jgi:hypothetical protein
VSPLKVRTSRLLRGATVAVTTGVTLALLASSAGAATAPAVTQPNTAVPGFDVNQYGRSFCGRNAWDWIDTRPRMIAHDSAGSCVKVPSVNRAAMSVTRAPGNGSFPNISSGYELNANSCPSDADMATGLCTLYPVKVAEDGNPAATVAGRTVPGYIGNFAFDIWFAPKAASTSFQNRCSKVPGKADTEIMIWLSHPGDLQPSSPLGFYTTRIDGRYWHVDEWPTLNHCPAGQSWRLVIFSSPRVTNGTVTVDNLKLNDFFGYAVRAGWLRPDEYLMAIDLGWEMDKGGQGNAIDDYTLTGLR